MTDIERLQAWLDKNGWTIQRLGIEMKIPWRSIYMMMVYRKRITANFVTRFIQCFGYEAAREIFLEQLSPAEVA